MNRKNLGKTRHQQIALSFLLAMIKISHICHLGEYSATKVTFDYLTFQLKLARLYSVHPVIMPVKAYGK